MTQNGIFTHWLNWQTIYSLSEKGSANDVIYISLLMPKPWTSINIYKDSE